MTLPSRLELSVSMAPIDIASHFALQISHLRYPDDMYDDELSIGTFARLR